MHKILITPISMTEFLDLNLSSAKHLLYLLVQWLLRYGSAIYLTSLHCQHSHNSFLKGYSKKTYMDTSLGISDVLAS